MAREALGGHIEMMMEDGEDIPAPMTSEEVKQHEFFKGSALTFMVDIPLPVRARRINIVLDDALIRRIDSVTGNRLAFLAEAARERLEHL